MPATLAPSPQLLSRASEAPNGEGWLHEIKYDGYRLLATKAHGRASLWSRPGADWTSRLPWIAAAVASLKARSACLDGELVYLTDEGFPDFDALQGATTRSTSARERLYYQVFDLLNIDGEDLTARPLLERKERLLDLLRSTDSPRLRYVAHVQSSGAEFFRAVDQLGLEGIVCKRARSVYRQGIRSADWVKVKCFRTQTFAIVGYTVADGMLESLALAGVDDSRLVYAGRVEFGVPRRDGALLRVLQTLCAPRRPIVSASQSRNIVWVEPVFSAEVRCLAWAPGRALRHTVLRSIRESENQVAMRFLPRAGETA